MIKQVLEKLFHTFLSILPMIVLVTLIYCLTYIPGYLVKFPNTENEGTILSSYTFYSFLICSFVLIIGSTLFQVGADNALSKVGSYVGANIAKKESILIMALVAFLVGLLITIAEPDLSVLSEQLKDSINPWVVKLAVGCGVGIFFIIGIIRTIFQKSIKFIFVASYFIIFAIACLFGPEGSAFVSLSFDSSGVTTGPATVPFVIAFGASIAAVRGGKDASKDSFGLTGIMSCGPILSMLILTLFIKGNTEIVPSQSEVILGETLLEVLEEVSIGLAPIFIFFYAYNFIFLHLHKKELLRILIGFLIAFIGLYLFMAGAKIGFLPLGNELGKNLASNSSLYYWFIIISLVIGLIIVLAEPAVTILTEQVEELSGGLIKKKTMSVALAIGVSAAITLEVCRIVFWGSFSSLYYIVPLYILGLVLTFFVPDIFVSVAFDSGGTASGAIASCFVLPFVIGASLYFNKVASDAAGEPVIINSGFGVITMIAGFPIVTIEMLGLLAKYKSYYQTKVARKRVYAQYDAQIIHFEVENYEN